MQHELVSLERRITELEDAELEVMERLEDAQADARRADRAARRRSTSGSPSSRRAARRRGGRHRRESPGRSTASARPSPRTCPDDLLALYEKLRAQKGGVGAALLRARRCGGCQLELDAADLARDREGRRRRGGPLRGVHADPGAHRRVGPVSDDVRAMRPTRSVIEADGGSRGNPGPAAYGAVLQDADTGEVIAERGEHDRRRHQQRRGVPRPDRRARAGRRARARTPSSRCGWTPSSSSSRCRGNWKIKHPDMRPLAREASRAGAGRARRTPGCRASRTSTPTGSPTRRSTGCGRRHRLGRRRARRRADSLVEEVEDPAEERRRGATPATAAGPPRRRRRPRWCWCATASPRTPSTSASPAGWRAATPGSPTRAAPRCGRPPSGWRRSAERIDAVVTSPVRRTRESAEILAERLGQRWSSRAGLRGDGVRHLGRADLRRGRASGTPTSSTPGSARSTWRRAAASRSAAVEKRVLAGLRAAARGARRPDGRRGQPRHADQDARRARRRRAAVGGVPDGAGARVGERRVVLPASRQDDGDRAPRCGCSTRCRPVTVPIARPAALVPLRAR